MKLRPDFLMCFIKRRDRTETSARINKAEAWWQQTPMMLRVEHEASSKSNLNVAKKWRTRIRHQGTHISFTCEWRIPQVQKIYLCPTSMMGGASVGYIANIILIISLEIYKEYAGYLAKDSMEKSFSLLHFVSTWPRKSNARHWHLTWAVRFFYKLTKYIHSRSIRPK